MSPDEFWELNENLSPESAAEEIHQRLVALSADRILDYQMLFDQFFAEAYRWNLWGAAYLIDGGCSDDGFMDFRYGLISRGRSIFEEALRNPDSLVTLADDSEDGYIPNEDFGYAASRAYKQVAGGDMPQRNPGHPVNPIGEEWDFDDPDLCRQHLPQLWAKFGE